MKTEEIVKALLLTPSRSKRTLLNTAANEIKRLTDRCARYAEEIAVLQERTRWIPVEERLPIISHLWGVSDVVLCIISDPSGYPPPNPGLCVYLENGKWTCHGAYVTVTHWMPLPDGPEVVEHD